MNEASVDMFDIVLITPGGVGAQEEAQRFEGHAKLITFVNSSDTRFGSPYWMKSLSSSYQFDFHAIHNVEEVVQAVDKLVKPHSEEEAVQAKLRNDFVDAMSSGGLEVAVHEVAAQQIPGHPVKTRGALFDQESRAA